MKRVTSVVVVAGTCVALAAQKADPAIVKLADQYQAAFNKGDAKALAALYTAEALRVTPSGELLAGRAAIGQDYLANLAGPFKGTKLTLRSGRTQTLKPDVALIEGTYEVIGGKTPIRGRYLNTVVQDGGRYERASTLP